MKRKTGQICVRLPEDILTWIDEKVERRVFYNKSHVVEVALRYLMKEMERTGKVPEV